MRFQLLSPLVALIPLASAVAIPQSILPTGQTVKQDIINIHNAVLALDAIVQAYDGGAFPTSLVDGTPILLGVAKIHEVNRAGYVHALAALPFSVEDTAEVIDTVTDTVNVSIPAATQHIKEKLAEFKRGLLVPAVIASLKLLEYDHDSFSAAVLAKANTGVGEAKIQEGYDGVANIHNAIQSAIDFYVANAL
ncbi:hypothetical protein E8E13_003104 [Curvularia kusanoi]|uniref:Uncharacterized protein n=1 Tax=Curvularia kusanoi TaxID=90978 RepID=A0A9P4T6F0_CURKU|nr:hypothetical protein E8E13_003104 [Curvularia kusanoi]